MLQSAAELALPAPGPSLSFHVFPHLPVELRQKIWRYSLAPRIVEVHARRSHYADDFQHGGVPKWQSGCNNPAALSVNSEARSAALDCYPIKLPLATIAPCEHAGDSINDLNRVLYINPEVDTVVVLGGDLDYRRLSHLLTDLRLRDPKGKGLQRLAVSASWTYHQGAGDTIRMLVQHMFPELSEMTVFIGTDYYKRYTMGRGQQMKDGDKWMTPSFPTLYGMPELQNLPNDGTRHRGKRRRVDCSNYDSNIENDQNTSEDEDGGYDCNSDINED
ncbi:unnamed protein product, partial [Clonostachys chloroleuca]